MASTMDGAVDLRCCASLVFPPHSQQQQQQQEEEVLVPHQELPNGTQPMEGLIAPFPRTLHVIIIIIVLWVSRWWMFRDL